MVAPINDLSASMLRHPAGKQRGMDAYGQLIHCRIIAIEARRSAHGPDDRLAHAVADAATRRADELRTRIARLGL